MAKIISSFVIEYFIIFVYKQQTQITLARAGKGIGNTMTETR